MTEKQRRVVVDTNILVSAILREDSVAARAVYRAWKRDTALTSTAILAELTEVLQRSKFDKARSLIERQAFLAEYALAFDTVEVGHVVNDCRDPSDNKFLELALSGNADVIVTGDKDLLILHPWRGIAILSPVDYLILD